MAFYSKKSLGQNFLTDRKILEKISGAAELNSHDIILEVGPGTGTLTQVLSEKAGRVVAVEKDHRLIQELSEKFSGRANIRIIEGDVLEFNPEKEGLRSDGYKIVANIPYYITSHFIRTILETWPVPKLIVLTIQKEVAQRIVAQPPEMSVLALSVQFFSDAKIVGTIKAGSFHPAPKVDSAIIQLRPRAPALAPGEWQPFFSLVKHGFSSKRKKLLNNLTPYFGTRERVSQAFKKVYIEEDIRAENLPLASWISLYHHVGPAPEPTDRF